MREGVKININNNKKDTSDATFAGSYRHFSATSTGVEGSNHVLRFSSLIIAGILSWIGAIASGASIVMMVKDSTVPPSFIPKLIYIKLGGCRVKDKWRRERKEGGGGEKSNLTCYATHP